MIQKQIELLLEDLACKKSYPARYGTECYICGELVEPGDAVYYMGNGHKICDPCMGDLEVKLEGML